MAHLLYVFTQVYTALPRKQICLESSKVRSGAEKRSKKACLENRSPTPGFLSSAFGGLSHQL
jgi:hypothetical protein